MSCSEAKRLANQRNAQKSTGPKTDAGKLVARLNALTHGMRSELRLVPPHLNEAVAKHTQMLGEVYQPKTNHQRWLLEQVADAAARLDYCQFMIRAELDEMADRADLCWNEDRKRDAEETASRLHKDPSRTVARLRETPQGCRWILARWDALSVSLSEEQGWTEDQCHLAAHLMGVGPDLRPSYPSLDPVASPDDQTALMHEQIDDLNGLLDALEPLDDKQRTLTQMGYPLRPSKEYLRFERYETKFRKVYTEALKALRASLADPNPNPTAEPLTALEAPPLIEPPVITPVSFDPAPEPPPSPEPEFRSGRSITAMLSEAVASFHARPTEPEPSPPSQARPKLPLDRRARRAMAAAARKSRKSQAH